MLSASNLTGLDAAQLRFIVGSLVTKAPIDLATHFRWHADAFTDGQVVDTLTPTTAGVTENDQAKPVGDKAEPVGDTTASRCIPGTSSRVSARAHQRVPGPRTYRHAWRGHSS
jgi:hypothetical protein